MGLVRESSVTLRSILGNFASTHKGLIVIYILMALVLPVKDIAVPHIFGKLVESFKAKAGKDTKIYAVIIVIVLAVFTVINYIDLIVGLWIDARFEFFIRKLLLGKLFQAQTTNYSELEIGQLNCRGGELPRTMFSLVGMFRDYILPKILVCSGIILYFVIIKAYTIASLLLGMLIAVILMIYGTVNTCSNHSIIRERSYVGVIKQFEDVLKNMMTILNFNKQPDEIKHFKSMYDVVAENTLKSFGCSIRYQTYMTLVIFVLLGIIVYILYRNMMNGKFKVSVLVTSVILIGTYMSGVSGINDSMKHIVVRWGIIQESLKMFDVYRSKSTGHVPVLTPELRNGFSIQNLTYIYDDGSANARMVFRDLNLHIPLRHRVLIVGKIGSGKSTLLTLLMKYKLPNEGEIYLNGVPYSSIPVENLRKHIGYVPQHPMLFNRTIYENIVYGIEHQVTRSQVKQLFYDLQLESMYLQLPQGLDTECGKNGSKLSGGQRQIVTIMRVMLQNPEVVLLDEPTSAIDENTKSHVMHLLQKVMENKTVIMVTHDDALTKHADIIITLDSGKLVSVQNVQKLH